MRKLSIRLSALIAGAITAALPAQGELDLEVCSAGIGTKVDNSISGGRPRLPFLFIPSLQRGNFALSAIDPNDSRRLGVGFDLLPLLLLAQFDASGNASFALPVPNDATLAGKSLLQQALAFPGTTTLFGAMSQVAVVPFEVPGAWRTYPQFAMNDKRAWISHIPLRDGLHLAAGGGNGALLALTAVATTERYDPATRTFRNGPNMTQARGIHTTNRLPDGTWLLAGGVNQNNDPQATCEVFDESTDRFTAATAMGTARMLHTGTALKDGRIFVAGGLTSLNGNLLQQIQSVTAKTEIYDPRTRSWSAGPDMSERRAGHTALLLPDGRVMLIGGLTLGFLNLPFFSNTADVFDPGTGKISRLAGTLRNARAGHSTALLPSGKVLVAGGIGGSVLPNGGTALSSCELYDFNTSAWTFTVSLATARGLMSSAWTADGLFVVTGGVQGSLLLPGAVPDCDAFDPAGSRWIRLPSLQTSRATHLAIELESCALFVLGGGSGQSGSALDSQEILYR